MVKVEFVCGESGREHAALLLPDHSTTTDLCVILCALLESDKPYIFLLDNTHQLQDTVFGTLEQAGRSAEQLVRLYYYPRQDVTPSGERLFPDWIRSVRCLCDGRVVVGVYDRTIRIHDTNTDTETVVSGAKQVVNDIIQSDNIIYGGGADGRVYQIIGNAINTSVPCSSAVQKLMLYDGLIVAAEHNGTISLHNPSAFGGEGKRKKKKGEEYKPVLSAMVHQDCVSGLLPTANTNVVSCGHDRRIHHIDLATLSPHSTRLSPASITSAATHTPTLHLLGHADGTLRSYDPRSATFPAVIKLPQRSWVGAVASLGNMVAAGDHAGGVVVFDVRQMAVPVWQRRDDGKVLAVDFANGGKKLYYGGEQCILRELSLT